MENKDSYTPQEVAEIVGSYVSMAKAIRAANNLESSPEVLLGVLGTVAEKDLFSLKDRLVSIMRGRIPENVFSSLRPELQDISKLL